MTISAANSIFQYLFAAEIGFFTANQQVSPYFAAQTAIFAAKLFYDQMARHEPGSLSGQTKDKLLLAASRDRHRATPGTGLWPFPFLQRIKESCLAKGQQVDQSPALDILVTSLIADARYLPVPVNLDISYIVDCGAVEFHKELLMKEMVFKIPLCSGGRPVNHFYLPSVDQMAGRHIQSHHFLEESNYLLPAAI